MTDRVVVGAPLGRWQTNCFVLADRARGEAVVVDPGEDGGAWVPQALDDLGVRATALLLTHGHIDHIWAVPELADRLDVPVFLHPEDRWLWDDPAGGIGVPQAMGERLYGGPWQPPTERLEDLGDGMRLTFAGYDLLAQHTPGHTPGHVTFLVRDLGEAEVQLAPPIAAPDAAPAGELLVAGDLLFRDSVGRTDFPRGDTQELFRSVERVVLPLADDVLVLTGHLSVTTVGRERARNPFLAELRAGRTGW